MIVFYNHYQPRDLGKGPKQSGAQQEVSALSNAHALSTGSFEKFNQRRKGDSRKKRRKASFNEMVRRAQERIIDTTLCQFNGAIMAENDKDVVNAVLCKVYKRDGRIGQGYELFKVLLKAVKNLRKGGVFVRVDGWYILTTA